MASFQILFLVSDLISCGQEIPVSGVDPRTFAETCFLTQEVPVRSVFRAPEKKVMLLRWAVLTHVSEVLRLMVVCTRQRSCWFPV